MRPDLAGSCGARAASRGLTMIEVLAAMVIFSAGAVVLFGWIGQAADRMGRLATEQKQLFAELAALEYAKSLNPMARPSGSVQVAGTEVRWRSTPVGLEQMARNAGGTDGVYLVQLYRVSLQAMERDTLLSERELLLAGWRQTRATRQASPFSQPAGNTPPAVPAAPAAPAPAPATPRSPDGR